MRKTWIATYLIFLSLTSGSLGQVGDPSESVATLATSSEPKAVLNASLKLADILYRGDAQTVVQTRALLSQQLVSSSSPLVILRVSSVLCRKATPEIVAAVVQRLEQERSEENQTALWEGLVRLIDRVQLWPDTQSRLLKLARAVVNNRSLSIRMVSAATMVTAQLGGEGFDALLEARNKNPNVADVFYTAIAESSDVRAVGLLREAAADTRKTEGMRIQAVRGLGQVLAARQEKGQTLENRELELTAGLLAKLVAEAPSDQFFSAALRSWNRVAGRTQLIAMRAAVLEALDSGRPIREEAGLDVVYDNESLQDPEVINKVVARASAARSGAARAGAAAILEHRLSRE